MFPLIGIAANAKVRGFDGTDTYIDSLEVLPLDQALNRQWPTDAHFTLYTVVDRQTREPLQAWPRIRKIALDSLRAKGADVEVNVLAFDWDTEGHAPLVDGQYRTFCELLQTYDGTDWDIPAKPSAVYATRAGARLIYVLSKPLTVERAEAVARGMIRDFRNIGLKLDESCCDWTRLFRLPQVVREGIHTWTQPYFDLDVLDNKLDPSRIAPEQHRLPSEYGEILPTDAPQPTPEEAFALLSCFNPESGKQKSTEWAVKAKRRLTGRDCYAAIYENAGFGPPGARTNSIQKYVGQACALLHHLDGGTAEHVYALFLPAAQQLEPDNGTSDWTLEVWKACRHYWNLEDSKVAALRRKEDEKVEISRDKLDRIIHGMRTWCDAPELHSEDVSTARDYARHHLVGVTSAAFYVMTPNGVLDSVPCNGTSLPARVRELEMDDVIEFTRLTERGVKELTVADVIKTHGTVIANVAGAVDVRENHIEDMGTERATLKLRLFRRKENLEPRYSKIIEDWMRSWFSSDDSYERYCAWIGHALAFEDGPICALSLTGPPGCGKKLLIQGLVECIDTEAVADDRELGNHQSALMRTPFLCFNEGLPTSGSIGGRDIADLFRHYVSGDAISINQKFRDVLTIRNPLRIVITANNDDVVAALTGHRDLSEADREAIVQRILHLRIDNSASSYLRDRGGIQYTGKPGARWIKSDAGAPSDYILARHFLWLYHRRPPVPHGNRLLIEGALDEDLLRQMATQSGSAPVVIESIVAMIENNVQRPGFHVDGYGIWVTPHGIVEYASTALRRNDVKISLRGAGSVLRSIRLSQEHTSKGGQVARWNLIDENALVSAAIEHGYKCSKLLELARMKFEKKRAAMSSTAAETSTG